MEAAVDAAVEHWEEAGRTLASTITERGMVLPEGDIVSLQAKAVSRGTATEAAVAKVLEDWTLADNIAQAVKLLQTKATEVMRDPASRRAMQSIVEHLLRASNGTAVDEAVAGAAMAAASEAAVTAT